MPLFGLPPYDDEEERRRRSLTPGINPNLPNLPTRKPRMLPPPRLPETPRTMPGPPPPSSLPELATPRPVPMPSGIPGGMPPPAINRQSRYGELKEAEGGYLKGTPGRFKSAALGALGGLGRGIASGQGLAGAIGGALGGAVYGGVNPRGQRKMEFNERIRPQIFERWQFEDIDRAQQAASAKAAADAAMQRAQMANIESQIGSRSAASTLNQSRFDYESNKPFNVPAGATAINLRTWQPILTATDPRQGNMTADQASAALTAEQGTVEEVSQGSLRGRLESLKGRLSADEKRIIEGGVTTNDSPTAIAQARARWQKIQEDELNSIRRDTGERRKAGVTNKRFGRKGTPGRTAISVKEAADLLR